MIGAINKLFRNAAAIKGKNEFEKVKSNPLQIPLRLTIYQKLIKASYSGDMKEPKEKHVIFILECLKGRHLKLIRPKEALKKLSDRFFTNLRSISLNLKVLIILHRALQEEEISQIVAHKIKEMEYILKPCQNDDQSQDIKMQCFISDLYINYIKNLINFIIISQLFQISLKDINHYARSLMLVELFLIFSKIDSLIDGILKVFQQKNYCQNYRIFHGVIQLLFVDLLKIYQSYYLLTSVMLQKFEEMELRDAKRAFIVYLNFIKLNREIRKIAAVIIQEFNIKLDLFFYDIDTRVAEALKLSIEVRERKQKKESRDTGSVESSLAYTTNTSPINAAQKIQVEKIEFMSESKRIRRNSNMMLDIQGIQGGQKPFEKDDFTNVQRTATVDYIPFANNLGTLNKLEKSETVKKTVNPNIPILEQYKSDPIKTRMELQFRNNDKILQKYENYYNENVLGKNKNENTNVQSNNRIQLDENITVQKQYEKSNTSAIDKLIGLKKFKSHSDKDIDDAQSNSRIQPQAIAAYQNYNPDHQSAIKINLSDDEGFKSVVLEDIFEENKELQSATPGGNNFYFNINNRNNQHGKESFFDLDSFLFSKDNINKENKNTFNLQSSMNVQQSYVNPQSAAQSVKFFSEDLTPNNSNGYGISGAYNHQEDESFQSCKDLDFQ
ncbi:UNKNOWN [Stylonychia lemnae]|uniref:Uncharacterized protein n=1 Tax=Stylonychia lemnae TaxID=5949 RepID=A0A078AC96_STYLE|nr:UNKNOWN [Stylonychia lemnae]|eukprot:CDW78428.1 UNKNOWN [Stylonychia lemnae]